MLVAALAAAPLTLAATGVTPTASASATVPSVKGEAKCNTETGKYDILWTVGGDTSVPNETATIERQSRATSPTLEGQSVKNTSTVTGSESVSTAGTYTLEVKVQWTNHAKGDLVTQQGSVVASGDCVVPTAPTPPPTQNVQCDAISANYHRPLTNGDHINANITVLVNGKPTVIGQVNMYVDQNISVKDKETGVVTYGADYNGQNDLGLRWKILDVEQTPIPLTLDQVMAGIITLPYGVELLKVHSSWAITFVQTNSYDTPPDFNFECPPVTPEEPPVVVVPPTTPEEPPVVVTPPVTPEEPPVVVTPPVTPEEPTPPTIIDEYEPVRAKDDCGIKNDHHDVPRDTYALTYTITKDTRVNGVGLVTTELTGKPDFALPKGVVTSWTFEFTNEACETTPPVEPPVVVPPVVTPPTETPKPPVVVPPTETPKPTPTPTETATPPVVNTPPATPPTKAVAAVTAKPKTLASTGVETGGAMFFAGIMLLGGAVAVGVTAFKRRHRKVTNE